MTTDPFNFSACTSVLAGSKATADGSTFIGRNEDAKTAWPKHFVIHAHTEFEQSPLFESPDNHFKMPLPKIRGKYSATPEWTPKFGIFEEDGFNEYGVAMSATESAYANSRVLSYDPLLTENGIGEEAIVTITLPYIHSAKEGVSYLGSLVEKYGSSETNGVLFSDQKNVWYMEIATGHHWVAQRIPDDSYAVVANQLAIQEINFTDSTNFMFSSGIQKFVSDNHLNNQKDSFNFRDIFGTHDQSDAIYSTPRVWYGQLLLTPSVDSQDPMSMNLPFIRQADHLIQREDLDQILGSHFQGTQYDPIGTGSISDKHKFRPISLAKTQESHILQIRPDLPFEIGSIHWLSMGVTAQSVYVPFFAGITDTPENYKIGTDVYDDKSAYWLYKQLGILVDSHYLEFGSLLKDLQKDLIRQFNASVKRIQTEAISKSGTDLTDFLTEENLKITETAEIKVKALISQLITLSTDLSPLNFKTDQNL